MLSSMKRAPIDQLTESLLDEELEFLCSHRARVGAPSAADVGHLLDALQSEGLRFPAHPARWNSALLEGREDAALKACEAVEANLPWKRAYPAQLLLLARCVGPGTPLLRAQTRIVMAAVCDKQRRCNEATRNVQIATALARAQPVPPALAPRLQENGRRGLPVLEPLAFLHLPL